VNSRAVSSVRQYGDTLLARGQREWNEMQRPRLKPARLWNTACRLAAIERNVACRAVGSSLLR
jgi:hypothetical protein